ncbi:hypothetical protein Z517_04462 [Fonsecaea pedrosoi CBS 271.37]|uniref:Uncharacterized protein n=1 Tax=Fonsecaea pedrosoi CBS 271.37 TaxID=1442368 RepID=A0A0D2F473_9EURO|nr:uncharacterized protein Z517_04462 [Fonsecaea pedrosoi CBS 271.37]KIW81437.1 hypothetical protein Z517_04462 [Fonsecaea pedrosoi CBS 271.37]
MNVGGAAERTDEIHPEECGLWNPEPRGRDSRSPRLRYVLLGPGGATLCWTRLSTSRSMSGQYVSRGPSLPPNQKEGTPSSSRARGTAASTQSSSEPGATRYSSPNSTPGLGGLRVKFPDFPWDLKIHTYGVNGVMGHLEPDDRLPKEVGIAGQVRAETQDQANQVASMVKFSFTHAAYPGQVATGGQLCLAVHPV